MAEPLALPTRRPRVAPIGERVASLEARVDTVETIQQGVLAQVEQMRANHENQAATLDGMGSTINAIADSQTAMKMQTDDVTAYVEEARRTKLEREEADRLAREKADQQANLLGWVAEQTQVRNDREEAEQKAAAKRATDLAADLARHQAEGRRKQEAQTRVLKGIGAGVLLMITLSTSSVINSLPASSHAGLYLIFAALVLIGAVVALLLLRREVRAFLAKSADHRGRGGDPGTDADHPPP
jgi:hypothetical protein